MLSPLALKQAGKTPSGVRKIETRLPEFSKKLELTIAKPIKDELTFAVEQCIALYLDLREHEDVKKNTEAQKMCIKYFENEIQR